MSKITRSLIVEAAKVLSGQNLTEGVSFFTQDLIDAIADSVRKSSSPALLTKSVDAVSKHINKTFNPKTSEGKSLVKAILNSLESLTKAVKGFNQNDFKEALRYGLLDSHVEDAIENLRKLDRLLEGQGVDLEGLPRFARSGY